MQISVQIKGQQLRTEQAPFDVDGFNRPRGRLREQTRRKELRNIAEASNYNFLISLINGCGILV